MFQDTKEGSNWLVLAKNAFKVQGPPLPSPVVLVLLTVTFIQTDNIMDELEGCVLSSIFTRTSKIRTQKRQTSCRDSDWITFDGFCLTKSPLTRSEILLKSIPEELHSLRQPL